MTPAITEELNLSKGVMMLSSYNVTLLPIQIRLHKNRLELVENLIKEHPR